MVMEQVYRSLLFEQNSVKYTTQLKNYVICDVLPLIFDTVFGKYSENEQGI